ncbi:MAG: hypothetical protein KDK23_16485 [Leptospiraceae bacterium]|nr:hypothetical protein [Leptospiraceae bacterium]
MSMQHPVIMWSSLAVAIVLGAIGQILMKETMKAAGPVPLDRSSELFHYALGVALSWRVWLLVFCYGISITLWLAVLSVADLSMVRPMMSAGYLITLGYGFYSGESVTTGRVLGTFLIIAGLFFVAKSQSQ